jgi:small-conductance mechanosensitive channel
MLDILIAGNTVGDWATALGVLAGTLLALRWLLGAAANRLEVWAKRTGSHLDDLAAALLGQTKFALLLVVAVWAASMPLVVPAFVDRSLDVAAVLALLAQIGVWGSAAITLLVKRYRRANLEVDAAAATSMSAVAFVGKLVLWSVVLVVAVDNLGYDVTALITGLGIGGVAIALAIQNILGDLFASLSIVLDQPFVLGDYLVVGEFQGSVEHIGLKTTRVRSLTGEQLVFSNQDLLESRIRNFGRLRERRVAFELTVEYGTPPETLERIPEIVADGLRDLESVRFERCYLTKLGDSGPVFETVYFVEDPSQELALQARQHTNLELLRRFEEEGVELAYPSRSVFVRSDGDGAVLTDGWAFDEVDDRPGGS